MFDGFDYVYEVYAEKSFSAAAKKLFISQPALSAAVKKVEKQLGITIFDRSTNPISLTREGTICIESIEQMRSLEQGMRTQLKDISDIKSGKITVSGENFISSFILPEIIIEFMKRYPGIEVELVESNTHDLMKRLEDEVVDILVAHDFDKELFVAYPLMDETLLMCVPTDRTISYLPENAVLSFSDISAKKHLSPKCPSVGIEVFAEEDTLILKKGNDMAKRVMYLYENAEVTPKVAIYPDQLLTAYNMSKAGLGCTVVTDNLILAEGENDRCCYYKLSGEHTNRKLAIGYKKKRYTSRAVEAFIFCAKEIYGRKNGENKL